MPAQSLTYGLSGNGAFNDPAVWTPREAPTPNSNQRLQVAAGTLVANTQPWQDYDLAVTGPAVVVFANETLDAASTVRVATTAATFGVAGAGLNSFADMAVGGSGAQATLNVQIEPGTAFINNGALEVNGNLLVRGDGAFVNNGSLAVENGTVLIQNLAFGLSVSSFVIGRAGTLEIGGFTNAAFAFEPGNMSR